MAAAAWRWLSVFGRAFSPNKCMPAPIAPELTRTTFIPLSRSPHTCLEIFFTACLSIGWDFDDNVEVPTFTTTNFKFERKLSLILFHPVFLLLPLLIPLSHRRSSPIWVLYPFLFFL